MRDQPLQNEWLLHQGGRVDLALGVALAPRATGPRRGPNQGCLRHCSLREWCPRAAWSWPVGSQTAALVPTKDSCPEGRVLPPWVSGQLVQHGGRAGGRSTGRSVLMPDLPVPEPFASPPPRERPPGVGGTRSSQRTAVRTGPDCGRRASPAAAAGMAWRGQDAGGRRRTGRRSPGEGFASETLIRNSCLLFNKHRTTGVKTYSLTSYEKPLSPTCAT